MKLYHGSTVIVEQPRILTDLRALDFGSGFYLTSNEEQARRWSKVVARRRRTTKSFLNIYELDDSYNDVLRTLLFSAADGEWLDFVVANRKEQIMFVPYDLVIGPVANDSTLPVIDDYMDGKYTKEEAVRRLMPQNLTDQYALLTEQALELLRFEEGVAV